MNRIILIVVFAMALVGCTSNISVEPMKNLGFSVYSPEYIPEGFTVNTQLDSDKQGVLITYAKEKEYIEIIQKLGSTYMYTNLVRNYFNKLANKSTEKEDPMFEYLEIGDFAGEVNTSLQAQNIFNYVFVPKEILQETVDIKSIPYYEIQSNIDRDEVLKLIKSLKKD